MWDRITQALAALGPAALALAEGQEAMDVAAASPEELVEYEGMLISASAAQRRRCDGCRMQDAGSSMRAHGCDEGMLILASTAQRRRSDGCRMQDAASVCIDFLRACPSRRRRRSGAGPAAAGGPASPRSQFTAACMHPFATPAVSRGR